jgi:hypothetical protein
MVPLRLRPRNMIRRPRRRWLPTIVPPRHRHGNVPRAFADLGKESHALVFAVRGDKIKDMLAPQYSLRRLLALVTLSALACLVLAAAIWGHLWAVAAAITMLGLVVTIAVHGLSFLLIRAIGLVIDRRKQSRVTAANSLRRT